jgi:hypothetical protein
MKALTLWQPWASLIMAGWKPYEFRRWAAPAYVVDQRIVVHAGARPVKRDEVVELAYRVRHEPKGTGLDVAALELLDRLVTSPGAIPLGAGLGTALLGRPRKASAIFRGVLDSDRIDEHVWAWPLSEHRHFTPVVPMRGAQGFWDWPAPVAG